MRLFLDCEFTRLSATAELISLALVAEDGREFYVELIDTWREEDCSDFVLEIVLPQLWGGGNAQPIIGVRIPRPSGHLFHEHPATDSTVIRPPVPRSSGHP